ncbi:SDR family NAD(P)-dependent oxidoreductase [Allokutzneria sp. A3M-2-11 16]|uniref:type I polyketide synthase n=1 Tax=Allokutzneria sp. A3M-2-11 16 TaxID=2962043 RepID=UPI0020B75F2D|nr:type I polyketide synthase [Allokutzneria sp. A3M-2-11 16]MCP3800287.1 SDR family NAD(P)-dependent oxidoreductase [Allokutzneria sp. A3M-2-11 16]
MQPIAIVGIGCRFPGGVADPRGFWDLLTSGTDAIGDIPPDRWRPDLYFDPDPATPGRMFVRQGGFLDAPVDRFDAGFFGMTPREAAPLDPQQRLLLEVAWEALEDAGIPPTALEGKNVGTYLGGFVVDAMHLQFAESNRELISSHTATGASLTMLSARLAYTFDWRGPCITLDTACSSSLVALHYACTAIANGECDIAVTGGVNVMLHPTTTVVMSKGQFLSPDGRSKAFDHRANGYARGEGAGLVVLKPLSSAQRDGDRIYAVVRGTAVNQDGRTPGITVPSAESQRAVVREACRRAGVEPGSIGYFEAHGTGTAVGDPIEANAIGEVLGDSPEKHWISSVKPNIGHLEAAAGVAGLIKAALCLDNGLIPPHLHFERPNPNISFETLPLRVPTELVAFESEGGPRRAGVNSFGFGGTNAHAVLEQAPPQEPLSPTDFRDEPLLLPISARSPGALRALADEYAELLEKPEAPTLRQVCRAAGRDREHHSLRAFVVADKAAHAAEKLRTLEIPDEPVRPTEIAFVYTGMGPQWWGMGRELLREEPVFAAVVTECDRILAKFGVSIAEEFKRDKANSRLTETLFAQIGNFVVQAGLTELWKSWGCEPLAIVGHSVGEVAAAYAAGVYSLEDALAVSFHRANQQARLAGRGAMLAVGLSAEELEPYLVDRVCVAAMNSPTATTLAGDRDALEVVEARLCEAEVFAKMLRVEVAYHSHHMDEIREPLLMALRDIRPRPAVVPLFSTVTGKRMEGTEFDAEYWWRNVREPVRFAEAVDHLLDLEPGIVLEVGPHPVLAPAIGEALVGKRNPATVLASLRRDRPEGQMVRETLGAVYAAGGQVAWERVHPGPREHIGLPTYPWQRERHWVESESSRSTRLGTDGWRMAARTIPAPVPTRETELTTSAFPYLADHRIADTIVFPGAGYIEAALALFDDDEPCVLENVAFHRTLVLEPGSVTTLRSSHDPELREITLHSRRAKDDTAFTLHASLSHSPLADATPPTPRGEPVTESLVEVGHDEIYARLTRMGLDYGPAFRALDRLWCRDDTGEIIAELDVDTVDTTGHRLHPALLDAAFQAMLAGLAPSSTFVPVRVAEVRFYRSPGKTLWVHGRNRRSTTEDRVEGDLTLITDDGEVVAELIGVRAQVLTDVTAPDETHDLYYEHAWLRDELTETGHAEGNWIVIGSSELSAGIERGLAERGGQVLRVMPEGDWPECRGVVFVHETDAANETACSPCVPLLSLVQALPTVALFVVTNGAQEADPFAASLWGFGRVVCAERPELHCRLIDTTEMSHAVVDELTHQGTEDVVLRGSERFVRRLERAGALSPLHHMTVESGSTPIRLHTSGIGLGNLGFIGSARRAPEPHEIEIAIEHTGLNFKDLSKAMGLLPRVAMENTHSETALGIECSGTVVRIGSEVEEFRAGDQVFALSRDLFASHATLDQVHVAKKPAALSFAEAASLFPALTAYTALMHVANVRPGERVLVHSGAGGVGLAAIRVAQWLGAKVFATAGSAERRDFLLGEGVAGVSDSRSTAFVDDVLSWTDGEGVDVVLNSIPGEILEKSLGLLRPFGRFVELGKADLAADRKLRLGAFNRSISFHSFDYDQMVHLRPELTQHYMRELARRYDERAFAPLPVVEVRADELDSAFRTMARREHIGKIVVKMAGEAVRVPARSMPTLPLTADGTYVVTGGLSGFGLAVAQWLADRGARHLLLIGRRGIASTEAEDVVRDLRERGVEVRVGKADVSRREALADALARARREMPPLRGVVHSAAVFDDALMSVTTAERFLTATAPKADGAWNLHLETEGDQLDFFVLFSSMASQLGASAVGPYAAANEFLNGLARFRRARGLPAISVNWGAVAEVGIAARYDMVGNNLRRHGNVDLPPARLLAELETLLRTNPVEASVGGMRWDRWAEANPHLAALPRFSSLVQARVGAGDASVPERLRAATREERMALLPELMERLLARVTGLSGEQLAGAQAITIDSLMGVELKTLIQNELDVSLPIVKLQQNVTVSGVVELVADALDQAPAAKPATRDWLVQHELVSFDGTTFYGHLSLPPSSGPHPAVVVCTADTGGALDSEGRRVRVHEHAPLVAAGFAVFTVDQRGAPGHGEEFSARASLGDRDVDDVVAAARYLAQLPEIDASRVNILGTSRGAYSALLALSRSPMQWQRAALLMGFYDPVRYAATERAVRPDNSPLRLGAKTGWDEIDIHFAAKERQPLASLDIVTTPLHIVHGAADELVSPDHARELAERAHALGLPAELVMVPGFGHDIDHSHDAWPALWAGIVAFLKGELPT